MKKLIKEQQSQLYKSIAVEGYDIDHAIALRPVNEYSSMHIPKKI